VYQLPLQIRHPIHSQAGLHAAELYLREIQWTPMLPTTCRANWAAGRTAALFERYNIVSEADVTEASHKTDEGRRSGAAKLAKTKCRDKCRRFKQIFALLWQETG